MKYGYINKYDYIYIYIYIYINIIYISQKNYVCWETIKMKPTDINSSKYIGFDNENYDPNLRMVII